VRRQMRERLVTHGVATLSVLTPEQRARHAELARRGHPIAGPRACPARQASDRTSDWL